MTAADQASVRAPYYVDEHVALYCGDFRDVLPALDLSACSAVVTDPPYGQTNLAWDRWPDHWPSFLAAMLPPTASMWTFGNARLLVEHGHEFRASGWKLRQDNVAEFTVDATVWEKHNGSGPGDGTFLTVHELVATRGADDATNSTHTSQGCA